MFIDFLCCEVKHRTVTDWRASISAQVNVYSVVCIRTKEGVSSTSELKHSTHGSVRIEKEFGCDCVSLSDRGMKFSSWCFSHYSTPIL